MSLWSGEFIVQDKIKEGMRRQYVEVVLMAWSKEDATKKLRRWITRNNFTGVDRKTLCVSYMDGETIHQYSGPNPA